jgi:hypothetical protein
MAFVERTSKAILELMWLSQNKSDDVIHWATTSPDVSASSCRLRDASNPDDIGDARQGKVLRPGRLRVRPASSAFRASFSFNKAWLAPIFGMSVQYYQRELAERIHAPYAFLSDEGFRFTTRMRLPTLVVIGMTVLARIVDRSRKAYSPCLLSLFPPDTHADEVLAWINSYVRAS